MCLYIVRTVLYTSTVNQKHIIITSCKVTETSSVIVNRYIFPKNFCQRYESNSFEKNCQFKKLAVIYSNSQYIGEMKHISATVLMLLISWALVINIMALDDGLSNITISIMPEVLHSTEPIISCNFRSACFNNVSYCSECSTVTLNELIDVSGGTILVNSAEIVFLPGTHIVNSSKNWLIFSSSAHRLRMNITGEGNVTVLCVSEFYLKFLDIEYVSISNLQFKYCNGHTSKTHDEVLTLKLYTNQFHSMIILDRIKMINQNRTGIHIIFKKKHRDIQGSTYVVRLTNSNIIAGNVVVYFTTNPSIITDNTYKIQMDNVSFIHSCFKVDKKAQAKHYEINIANVRFTNGSCSPVLLLPGHAVVRLTNLTMKSTSSVMLLHSVEKNFIFLQGHCRFYDNSGAVLIASKSELVFVGAKVEFIKNYVEREKLENPGAMIAIENSIAIFNDSHVRFEKNYGQNCGGIAATNEAVISFSNSTVEFTDNNGSWGGAMSLYSRSKLINGGNTLNSTLTFTRNKALEKGGAIYIEDRSYVHAHKVHTSAIQTGYKVQFKFFGNEAYKGGNNIYGGWVDWMISMAGNNVTYDSKIGSILHFENNNSEITSDPTRLCLCVNNIPNCRFTHMKVKAYPGEKFSVNLVGVGQRYGRVETLMKVKLVDQFNTSSYIGSDGDSQNIKATKNVCTTLECVVLSLNKRETLMMTTWSNSGPVFEQAVLERYPDKLGLLFEQLYIQVQLKECPLGFLLDKKERKCICYSSLRMLGLSCNSHSYKINRTEKQWIGMVSEHMVARENPGVIVHQNCPFDYCRTDQESLLINLEHQDEQCAFNRSGILCGGCQTNFSRVLGSSKCKICSNLTLLIFPGVILAGLLLVVLLMVLDLTVSVGTINGLLFYANVVQIQYSTFFGSGIRSNASFLSMFIAWLNLDLGIECCLCSGLDTYTETWLQFCFPLYIWLLTAVIIVLSHYSTQVSKLGGKNAVKVLATLLLFSYTKFLRLFVVIISYTEIVYPDGYSKSVWLYDSNINYLKGKHIPLFIASILLLLLFTIPYSLFLLGIQWFHKISVPHYSVRRLIQSFKLLSDAYREPYKPSHCYWSGLILFARIVLVITFSADRNNGPNISLLVTIILSSVLQVWIFFTKWVYKCNLINCFEVLCLCNLGITSTVLLLELSTYNTHHHIISTVVYLSTGIAFLKFILVLIYHVQRAFFLTEIGTRLKRKLLRLYSKDRMELEMEGAPNEQQTGYSRVTYTVIDLTQPLMKN